MALKKPYSDPNNFIKEKLRLAVSEITFTNSGDFCESLALQIDEDLAKSNELQYLTQVASSKPRRKRLSNAQHRIEMAFTEKKEIYLDYNATTPMDAGLCDEICNVMKEYWRNPSSSYAKTERAIIKEARERLAIALNCRSDQLTFTSCSTEAANTIINSVVRSNSANGPCRILTSNFEHPCILRYLNDLRTRSLVDISEIDVEQGQIKLESLDRLTFRMKPQLVIIMLANNVTGILQPVKEAVAIIRRISPESLVFCDICQAIGKVEVDISELGIDYATIAGHKFYGPRIGAMRWARERNALWDGESCLHLRTRKSCNDGERKRRFYTMQTQTFSSAGLNQLRNSVATRIKRDLLEELLLEGKSADGVSLVDEIVGFGKPRLPNTSMIRFKKEIGSIEGLLFSYGAACHDLGDRNALKSVKDGSEVKERLTTTIPSSEI
ncbi:hypothetical protein ACOME3_001343 [Neoechinorhynchus agilis]